MGRKAKERWGWRTGESGRSCDDWFCGMSDEDDMRRAWMKMVQLACQGIILGVTGGHLLYIKGIWKSVFVRDVRSSKVVE